MRWRPTRNHALSCYRQIQSSLAIALPFWRTGRSELAATNVPSEYISLPTAYTLEHPTTGDPIHAIYWPPTNPEYAGGLPGELPPVVVNIHGGPTHMVWQGLNWETQLFTSRGFGW